VFSRLAALLLALVPAAAQAGSSTAGPACRPTIPAKANVPRGNGVSAASFNYGTRRLRTAIYWPRGVLRAGMLPDGGSMASLNHDGSISLKLGWWRGVAGKLTIRARRLDAAAPPVRGDVPDGYGPKGFQASVITFPTTGCWRVVGAVADARLAFVVRVTKIRS
jgi:hypothetical protein